MTTDEGAPNKRVFKVDPKKPARADWKELIPEDKGLSIESVNVVGGHITLAPLGVRGGDEAWVARNRGRAHRDVDEGTPVDLPPVPPGAGLEGGGFVAGEIDVPTPTPELHDDDSALTRARPLGGDP